MITHKTKSDLLLFGSVIDFAMHEIGNVEPYVEHIPDFSVNSVNRGITQITHRAVK
jgi:hypothetical protein